MPEIEANTKGAPFAAKGRQPYGHGTDYYYSEQPYSAKLSLALGFQRNHFHANTLHQFMSIQYIAAAAGTKFILQRPEYPDFFAGWNSWNLPIWTSCSGDACFVRPDELVDTMIRLSVYKPVASLYSPTTQGEKQPPAIRGDELQGNEKIQWPGMRVELRHMISQWVARQNTLCAAEQELLECDIKILRDII